MISLKDFFSFKKNRWFWVNIIILLMMPAVIVVAALWGLDTYTRHGESFVVPEVKGVKLAEAEDLIRAQRLNVEIVDFIYTEGVAHNIVLDQIPAGGAHVKKGRTIYLTVNTAEIPKIKIPDVIDNSSMRQAAAQLKASSFKLTEPELVPGEQDWVYGIKYRGRLLLLGDSVPKGASLTLCVGDTHLRDSLAAEPIIPIPDGVVDDEPKVDESWF